MLDDHSGHGGAERPDQLSRPAARPARPARVRPTPVAQACNGAVTLNAAEEDEHPGTPTCVALMVVILAGMEITGLGWGGTRTGRSRELAHFYEHVLGLRLVHQDAEFWVFELPDGRLAEIFGKQLSGQGAFRYRPGCRLRRPRPARGSGRVRGAGVELLGEPGPTWQHFRGPDGNVYELVAG